jgi:hypothetical protein
MDYMLSLLTQAARMQRKSLLILRVTTLLGTVLAISISFIACERHTAGPETQVEVYSPAEGAVGVDILPAGGSEGARGWLATYADEQGRTTKFRIELAPARDGSDQGVSSGQGKFLAETESDPIPLLDSLKKALQAKRMPKDVQKADVLPFTYLLLGENQSRLPTGGFRQNPAGNWTAMKIFLANDQAEVYFNFNPVIHKAEFSIKNPSYGDLVLGELAKVL